MNAVAQPVADLATAQKALNKAKIMLMENPDDAFFTAVCFSLKHEWDTRRRTAATDGRNIFFNPAFFMSLTIAEQVFLILHETLHAAFLHMDRLGERNKRKWNIAADYVINYLLVERGHKMPQGGLYDPQYAGMSTEEVYNLLPDNPTEDVDIDLLSPPADSEQIREEMDEILVRARTQAQMQGASVGAIPGQINRYLDELLNPRIPWNRILARFMTRMVKQHYTFLKPNRRFFPQHILPTQYSEGLGHIAVALDTSASVSDERFGQCISELFPLVKNQKPEQLTLLHFDTRIKAIDEIRSIGDLKRVTFTGKGGTNIEPLMDWAATHKPDVLLVFTDGHFRKCDIKPASPLVWLIYENKRFTAKHGKVIHID